MNSNFPSCLEFGIGTVFKSGFQNCYHTFYRGGISDTGRIWLRLVFKKMLFSENWFRAWFGQNHKNLSLKEQDIDSKLHVDRRPRGLWIVCDCLSKIKALLSILSNRRAFIASVLIIMLFLNSSRPNVEKSTKSSIRQESVSNKVLDLRIAWGRLLIGRHWNRKPLLKFSRRITEILGRNPGPTGDYSGSNAGSVTALKTFPFINTHIGTEYQFNTRTKCWLPQPNFIFITTST